MITVEINGGLGNQMFEFAAGRFVSQAAGTELAADLRAVALDPLRGYVLPLVGWSPDAALAVPKLRTAWAKQWMRMTGRRMRSRPLRKAIHLSDMQHEPPYSELFLGAADGCWMEGYWQDAAIVFAQLPQLRALTAAGAVRTAAHDDWAARIDGRPRAVSLHVRLGDYTIAGNARIGLLSPDYYERAVSQVLHEQPDSHFFLFSDEPVAAVQLLPQNTPYTVVDSPRDEVQTDLLLMSRFRRHVIANSTYSWWGAALADSQSVLLPARWFNDPVLNERAPHLVLPGWCPV